MLKSIKNYELFGYSGIENNIVRNQLGLLGRNQRLSVFNFLI